MSIEYNDPLGDELKIRDWLDKNTLSAPSMTNSKDSKGTEVSNNSGATNDTIPSDGLSGASGYSNDSQASAVTSGTDEEGTDKPREEPISAEDFAEMIALLEKEAPVVKKHRDDLKALALRYAEGPADDAWQTWKKLYNKYCCYNLKERPRENPWITYYYSTLTQEQTAPLVFHAYMKGKGANLRFTEIEEDEPLSTEYTKLQQIQGCESVIKARWIDACRFSEVDYVWQSPELNLFAEMYRVCERKPRESEKEEGEKKELGTKNRAVREPI